MDRVSMFSVVLVTWLIVFNPHLITKTVGHYVHNDDYDVLTPTEDDSVDLFIDDPPTTVIISPVTTQATTESYQTTESTTENYQTTETVEETTTSYSDDKKKVDEPASSSDDIIHLNVGGHRIITYRSTLTALPNSKLARIFAKKKENQTETESRKKLVYFFDYNPVQFEYLLDQLRAIKREPQTPAYDLTFTPPKIDVPFNFSQMLLELGLNSDRFLFPLVGTHLNLKVNSLIGWKECYRGKYNAPFDTSVLFGSCKGKRLLVACRSTNDKNRLIVSGIGKRENLFKSCSSYSHCTTDMKNGTGFYYVQNQAWGFEGHPNDADKNSNVYNSFSYNYRGGQESFYLNPCDPSDQHSEYRLCWSLRSNTGRGGGDRCGSSKNLHNTQGWERLIYQTV